MDVLTGSVDDLEPSTHPKEELHGTGKLLWTSALPNVHLSYFDNGLLEMGFPPDTVLTSSMVQDILALLSSRLKSDPRHMLANISGLNNVDGDATRVFSKVSTMMRIALLGTGPADRVLARFFMRGLPEDLTCHYTQDRAEAMSFLFTT